MKIGNEIKVGILAVISIFLLIWGVNFLKGKNLLSNTIVATVVFSSVDGLNIAAPVTINGLKVGAVTAIRPNSDYSAVIVELNIEEGTKIPKNALASIVQPSLMGGKEISLEFVGDCGSNCLATGDQLQGNVSGMMDGIMSIADPYMGKIDTILGAVTDLSQDPKGQFNGAFNDLQLIIGNVKVLTDLVNNLLLSSSSNIAVTMSNLTAITENIKQNNAEITGMLQNINTITQQIKEADLQGTIGSAKGALDNIDKTVGDLQTTVAKANTAIDNVNTLLDFSKQEGLVAALFNDPKFKGDVTKAVDNLNRLMADIRNHPERYRTVLSGKYKPYVDPKDDPKLKKK